MADKNRPPPRAHAAHSMPHPFLVLDSATPACPVWLVDDTTWESTRAQLADVARGFAEAQGFEAKPGRHCLLPNADGSLAGVLFATEAPGAKRADPFLVGKLPPL